jgi:glycosyltransferase involved in cell wall biosynthesis
VLTPRGSRAGAAVTPLVLTFDEAPNLARALDSLGWAERVVILDSGSTDGTAAIAARYPNAAVFTRPFDGFKGQTEHGLRETGIDRDYVLALDADMAVTPVLLAEIEGPFLDAAPAGGLLPFEYRILGRPLLGSLLGPQLRIFRRSAVRVVQEGHGHKFSVEGPVHRFAARLVHDDRKSIERWAQSQIGYSRHEQERMARVGGAAAGASFKDRLRRAGLMPLAAGALAYARAGGPLRGGAALRYAYERVVFECLLAMRLLGEDADQHRDPSGSGHRGAP